MGSGISLSDKQVCQIIKRDLSLEYHTLIIHRKYNASPWELCKNYVDDAKYNVLNNYIDSIYKLRQKSKNVY